MKSVPIRILNISIEMESEDGIDPEDWEQFRKYIRYLWDNNIMIVAAAGNKGPNPMTLSPIGECGGCVCVGCHDGDYKPKYGRLCNEYSSRGPGKDISAISNPLKNQTLWHLAQILCPVVLIFAQHPIFPKAELLCQRLLSAVHVRCVCRNIRI